MFVLLYTEKQIERERKYIWFEFLNKKQDFFLGWKQQDERREN